MNAKILMMIGVLVLVGGGLGAVTALSRKSGPRDSIADVPADAVLEQKPEQANNSEPPVKKSKAIDEVVRECLPSVALVKGKVGHGAGFLLPNNVLATNAHVVALEFEENIRIHFPSAPKKLQGPYKAKFLWADKRRDLAFLEVDCDVEPLELAEEYTLKPGQEIVAIGSPGLGGTDFLPNAPTRGLMSNVTKLEGRRFYAMSISVNPGNSGGPVIDMDGQVLGMVTAKMRDKEGIAFAIPLEDLRNGYDQEVIGQGREAGPEMIAWLRACTVIERLMYLGEEYCAGLETYWRAMDLATSRGGTPNDGLRSVAKELESRIQQINRVFADDLEKNVKAVTAENNYLRAEDRDRIDKLWRCCTQMKTMFDRPSGTVNSYRARKDSLQRQYQTLTTFERPNKPAKGKS